ncbi:MAG TPA: phosphodiester glycosidase family protein [Anaerolineae bacterium]|nr:phosphodiester glycosidase family protein [Anaerolineae bacterium]
MKAPWLLLVLLLFSFAPDVARPNCRSDIQGVTYCVEDDGDTHLLVIDLTDPYLRVQTVMANDVLDVWPPEEERESVSDMAQRFRHDGVIAAINADYFGTGRGPEGPTVVQGQRLDTLLTIALNPSRYRRTTLALSRSGQAAVAHLNPIGSLSSNVYRDPLFNAVSGGPIILYKGRVLPEALSCLFDDIPMGACRRDRQTAAGVDEAGQTLYLLASEQRSTSQMAELLRDYGAFTAMKLDGGGSTQLWYRGRTLVDSDRDIANALLIFKEDTPRHAAKLIARPPVQLIEEGAPTSVGVKLRNVGHLDWTVDRYYGLRLLEDEAWAGDFLHLSQDVAPNDTVTFTLPINSSLKPGVYTSTWQLTTPFESFGPTVPVDVVVIPQEAADLQKQIQPLLTRLMRLSDKSYAVEWPKTAQKVQQLIEKWVKKKP